jgi:hypothetical protein
VQTQTEFLSRRTVDRIHTNEKRTVIWDSKVDGFGLRVSPNGSKTFVFVYRFPRGRSGKVCWYKIGTLGDFSPETARTEAAILRGDYLRGIDPMARIRQQRADHAAEQAAPKKLVDAVVTEFINRYAQRHNRSWKETQRILTRHIVRPWGKRPIASIKRSEVNELLDEIEDASGAPMATAVLAQLRKMFNWYAARNDEFNSPIVKGMARTNPAKLARDRVLSDLEIRILWKALDASPAPYRQLVRFLLLTAQRRDEASKAHQSEFSQDTWTIPAARYKTGICHIVPISSDARSQIDDLKDLLKLGKFTFTTRGDRPFSGFSKAKRELDARMEVFLQQELGPPDEPDGKRLVPWRLHDLRRTAKTLMVRAGVRPDISERVLGHVIKGVEGTYDRHDYMTEKRAALESLAVEVRAILNK